jgi:glycosyltransferase involved in cell wall biosynthesis
LQAVANAAVPRRGALAVHYGGARTGDIGGPLVKVKRLSEHFPDTPWGYDLVYLLSNAPYVPGWALRLLKVRGVPIVYNQNGVFYRAWYGGDWAAENRRMAEAFQAADWVFYQSDFCRRCADRFLGPRTGGGEVLYNAVDTQRFVPPANADRDASPFDFLVTGKIGDHLAYRLTSTIGGLAEARKAGLEATLTIAGWVEEGARREAAALAETLGVASAIRFTGAYRQAEAPVIYGAAQAYVMMKHNDPCPNTVLEALACGLPVLYSATGGVPELVGADAGVAVACPEDFERAHVPSDREIGDGMLKIADARLAMSAAARRRAIERFDIAHWIARHRDVFETLTGRS